MMFYYGIAGLLALLTLLVALTKLPPHKGSGQTSHARRHTG